MRSRFSKLVAFAATILAAGCNYAPVRDDAVAALELSGVVPYASVDRSTRWTIPASVDLRVDCDFRPDDAAEARAFDAAFAGVLRVFPQARRANAPITFEALRAGAERTPAELVMHIVVPAREDDSYTVSLLDGRSLETIDHARLAARHGLFVPETSTGDVSRLFATYSAQFLARH